MLERSTLAVGLLAAAQVVPAEVPRDLAPLLDRYHRLTAAAVPTRCGAEVGVDEIVVCGRRDDQRLPLPELRGPPNHARRRSGEVPSASLSAGAPPTGDPSRGPETWGRIVSAILGVDPS